MASLETFGKCKCGEYNPLSGVNCSGCGARLPWAVSTRKATGGYPAAPNSAASGATPRTKAAQAGYWNAALTGAQGSSYMNDPDIDFTPMTPMSRADHYCPSCGTGLSRTQDVCPRCRHMKSFTRADLRLTAMVSGLVVAGFLLGVVWTSFLVTYLQTGKWPFQSSTPTTQVTPAKKAPPKAPVANPAPPRPEYSGTPGR